MSKQERDRQLDIVKGILIAFVVIGHTYTEFASYIYWFHMPVFFIVNGILYHDNQNETVRDYIIRKGKRLFIPYIMFGLVECILYDDLSLKGIIRLLYSGRLQGGVYWFIPVLFLGNLIFFIVRKYVKGNQKQFIIYLIVLIVCVLESAFLKSMKIEKNAFPLYLCFPWNIDVAFMASFYIALGYSFRSIFAKLRQINSANSCLTITLTCLFMLLAVIDYTKIELFELDMKYSEYSNVALVVLIPIGVTCILTYISSVINKCNYLSLIFEFIGKISTVVMYIHLPIRDLVMLERFGSHYSILGYLLVVIVIAALLVTLKKSSEIVILRKKEK